MRKRIKEDRYVNMSVGGTWYLIKLSKLIELFNKGDIIDKGSIKEPIDSISREELQQCLGKEEDIEEQVEISLENLRRCEHKSQLPF